MNNPELKKLLELMNDPEQLTLNIDQLRGLKNVDTSILGFIAMYDSFNGDCEKLKEQIASNKNSILKPIKDNKKTPSRFYLLKIAAIFVLIVSSSYLIYSYFITPQLELSPRFTDPGIPIFMSSETNTHFTAIMFHYQKKEYGKAEVLIQTELKLQPGNDTLIYYTAVLKYLESKGDMGWKDFERLRRNNRLFKAKAMYYQGLINVKKEKFQEAIKSFGEVVNLENEDVSSYAIGHLKQIKLYLKEQE
ncbi:MAG: hypothetical protein KA521_00665 [Crocinitomicaceae bacterium]|nr:hypothetical protein [Crocinitomicaceae bacterium]